MQIGKHSFPFGPNHRGVGLRVCRPSLPFTLPAALGDGVQGRGQAVRVVADITVVAQQQAGRVRGLPTHLTHDALQAAPAFT